MKSFLPILAFAVVAAFARPAGAQPSFEERLAAKLDEPFIKNAAWVQDYDEALKQARDSGRVIFAYFTRSYSP